MQTTALQNEPQKRPDKSSHIVEEEDLVESEEILDQPGIPRFLQRFAVSSSSPLPSRKTEEDEYPDERHVLQKPVVGAPDDEYEKEADEVADRVMRMPEPNLQRHIGPEEKDNITRPQKGTTLIQREPAEADKEKTQVKQDSAAKKAHPISIEKTEIDKDRLHFGALYKHTLKSSDGSLDGIKVNETVSRRKNDFQTKFKDIKLKDRKKEDCPSINKKGEFSDWICITFGAIADSVSTLRKKKKPDEMLLGEVVDRQRLYYWDDGKSPGWKRFADVEIKQGLYDVAGSLVVVTVDNEKMASPEEFTHKGPHCEKKRRFLDINGSQSNNNFGTAETGSTSSEKENKYPPVYWSIDRAKNRAVVIPKAGVNLHDVAQFLYGDPTAVTELAKVNNLPPTISLMTGIPLQLTGGKLTEVALINLNTSAKIPLGQKDPEAFFAKKRILDGQLEKDFHFIVSKLDEAHYSDSDEGEVIAILKKWAEEKFAENPALYPAGGEYLDKLFSKLNRKTKDVGVISTQITNYYSMIFNHFDRITEVRFIRDVYSRNFKRDNGLKEMSFGSYFWDQVKEGKVRDQIFAYFKGLGKGIWSGAKGAVMMAYTLVTDPKKFLNDLKNLPSALSSLWEKRSELWNKFANSTPEEQAEMIGEVFGEIEFMIGSAAAGGAAAKGVGKLAEMPGTVGKIAKTAQVVTKLPQKALGAVGKGVKTVVVMGVKGAAEGAKFAARGIYRVGKMILRGTWSVVEKTVDKITKRIYYFFDEATGVLREIPAKFARKCVKCSTCKLLEEAVEIKKFRLIETEVLRIRKLVRGRLRNATKKLEKANYPEIFKESFKDFPGGRLWQVHHELEQMFRLIFKKGGINIDNLRYLKGVQTIGKKQLESVIKKHLIAWEKEFKKIYKRKPTTQEINKMRLKALEGAEETANLHKLITRKWEDWFNQYLDNKILGKLKKGEKIIPEEILPSIQEISHQAAYLDWIYGQFYWEVRKAFRLPVPIKL